MPAGKSMKEKILLAAVIAVLLSSITVFANDPPHNNASGVTCGACHGSALFTTVPENPEELRSFYDSVCTGICHNFSGGIYHGPVAPTAQGHSYEVIQGSHVFSTLCVDCHQPHYQEGQFFYGNLYYKS